MKNVLFLFLTAILFLRCTNESEIQLISEENVREIILSKLQEYSVPGIQVCIINKSQNTEIKISEGFADLDNNIPMTNNTRLKVGSITKSFTGIGILLLSQREQLDLSSPIKSYITLDNSRYENISVKNLLNMCSGLKGYINDDDDDVIINQVIENPNLQFDPMLLARHGLELTDNTGPTPENEFHYNNTNYILLGKIIENITGTSYKNFVKTELLNPLYLSDTYVSEGNNYEENVSCGYHINLEDNTRENYSNLDLSYVWSAGAVISTASDLCKWITAIGTGNLISGNTLQHVFIGQSVADSVYYTSGLINEPSKLWHNGTVLGYHGEMCYLKTSGTAITVLSNCSLAGVEGDPVKEILNEIIDQINID